MTLLNRMLLWSLFLLSFAILVGGDFWHGIFRTDHYKAPHFSLPEFVDAQDVNGSLVCFGDFNADTFTDVFVLSPDRSKIMAYAWQSDAFRFSIVSSREVSRKGILSVSAADFNYDGRLDLLVQAENTSAIPPTVSLHIYLGNKDSETFAEAASPSDALAPVLVMEADGDSLRPDLYGTDAITGKRGVWLNQESGWTFEAQVDGEAGPTSPPLPPLLTPQLSAFVDLNGDCRADLVVASCSEGISSACTKPSLEVWLNGQFISSPATKSSFTQQTEKWPLPVGVRQISFADFDADGAADMLLVVCPTAGCTDAYVAIAYGKLKPLCNSIIPLSSDTCRALTLLCTKDDGWDFPAFDSMQSSEYYVVGTSNSTRVSLSLAGDMTVRIGDYDLDGYPDLVIPIDLGLQLWRSRACDGASCAPAAASASRRTFAPDFSSTAIRTLQNIVSAAFMDLGEKGSLDLLVVTKPPNGVSRPATIYNNLVLDAFFLKTLGLNGKCAAWCPEGDRFPDKPYGGVQVGGTFMFSTTRVNGERHLVQATTLSQVGVLSLQTPYAFFGLGRTNSYVEMLYYGMPLRESPNHHYWTPIMPNAQVYVVPYPPDHPASWSIDSFISPAHYVGWVFVAFAVALIINGGIVMFFRARELREDENEKKASAHLFSFDIL